MRKVNYDKETCEYCHSFSNAMCRKYGFCMKFKRKVKRKEKFGCFH